MPLLRTVAAVALCASVGACAAPGAAPAPGPARSGAGRTASTTSGTPSAPAASASHLAATGGPSVAPSSTGSAARTVSTRRYVTSIRTTDPVVFITIDDGAYADPAFLAFMKRSHLPVTVFLTAYVAKGPRLTYFQQLQRNGAVIENHTVHHPDLTRATAAERTAEICGASAKYVKVFGQRPTLLRPPYGAQNAAVLASARGCGIRAVVGWNVVQDVTGGLQSSHGHQRLEPGDIIIFHFKPGLNTRLQKVLGQIRAQHLRVALLEDYV